MGTPMTKPSTIEKELFDEVQRLLHNLNAARIELAAITHAKDSAGADKNIGHASVELSEVVRHTEEATNNIMDACEAMQSTIAAMVDKNVANSLFGRISSIMEACSFQDITGQRIKKVKQTLIQIEQRVENLSHLIGGSIPANYVASTLATGKERADEALMAGPQMAGEGMSQEDVDKLLNSNG
jgi:chemotaxis protein CheZ